MSQANIRNCHKPFELGKDCWNRKHYQCFFFKFHNWKMWTGNPEYRELVTQLDWMGVTPA